MWGVKFFTLLFDLRGYFIKCDDITLARLSMEEARVCIKTSCKELINDFINVVVDRVAFIIKMREDHSLMKEEVVGRKTMDEEVLVVSDSKEEEIALEEVDNGGGDFYCFEV